MKLGFDIDGITCDMGKGLLEAMNERFGLDHDVNIFKDHTIHNNKYVDDDELNKEIADHLVDNVVRNSDALVELEVFEDAVLATRKLSKAGHSIHHITSRPANQRKATVDWLRNNSIPFDTLHVIGRDETNGHLYTSKGRVGRSLNLDFYMDDCVWHLDDMYRYKNRWRKGLALFTQPWNKDEAIDLSMYLRFDNWKQIIRHLGIHKR